jgi:alanine racemase
VRPAFLEIDLAAVRENVQAIQRAVGPLTAVGAIVKANAYGHGAVEVARAAIEAGAQMLCVAIVDEGIELREAGLEAPILVLGPPNTDEADAALQHDLMQAVSDPCHASIIAHAARRAGRCARVHVKLDTGMGRHGARPGVAEILARLLAANHHLEVAGVFSHFADAYEPELCWAGHQLDEFLRLSAWFGAGEEGGPMLHLCNSVGLLRMAGARLDMVRPGSILYGFNPGFDPALMPDGIRPVASLKTQIGTVKLVEAGEPVGYGCTWRAPHDSCIAVLPLGYADGYPRTLSSNAEVLISGRRCPVVGRISMDAITVDATDADSVGVGDEAVLIGAQGDERITIEELARRAGTIGEEITSRLSRRLPRVYLSRSDT